MPVKSKTLDQRTIDALVKRAAPGSYPIGGVPGLAVRITTAGHASWSLQYRVGRNSPQRRKTWSLATFPKAADVRGLAREILAAAEKGHDLPAQHAAIILTANDPRTVFGTAVDEWLAEVKERAEEKTHVEYERMIDAEVRPLWGDRQLASITRSEVKDLVKRIQRRGAPVMANRVLKRLKTFFSWCAHPDQGIKQVEGPDKLRLEKSPIERMAPVHKEVSRERELSPDELRWFWLACGTMPYPYQQWFRLLLLTGARLTEVRTMRRDQLDMRERPWKLGAADVKNDNAHYVPLSSLAVETLESVPAADAPDRPFLFSVTDGREPVVGVSYQKAKLDAAMEAARRADLGVTDEDGERRRLWIEPGAPLPGAIPPWTLHDLRRTMTTIAAERLNWPAEVADKLLNHERLAGLGSTARIYNRAKYLTQRRAALEGIGEFVRDLIGREPGPNVVPLRRAR